MTEQLINEAEVFEDSAQDVHGQGPGADEAALERATLVLERALVEPYLLASLRWSAVRWDEHPELLDRGLTCYRYLAGRFFDQGRRGFTHLPLSLVVDLLALIELGDRTPFSSERLAHTWSGEERRLRVDYENQLLGSLLQEPAFVEARERLPSSGAVRASATQRVVELLLHTFSVYYPVWFEIEQAHLRDLIMPAAKDIDPAASTARFDEATGDGEHFAEALRLMLNGISNHVYWREVLKPEDLFEIENWAVLDNEATRIGSRQISEVERRLSEFRLPRLRLRDEAMEVDTDFDDDTTYPTGGFSGLTTRGSFENLVRSELVYMEDSASNVPSLFELRYVEGELLFYLRNDGVMRRRRRIVHIILDLDVAFHSKSPGYEYPFSTLAQGLIVRLTRDLFSTFEEDAVTVHIHYVTNMKRQPARDAEHARRERERVEREQALLMLVLGREIRQERVHVNLVEDIDPTTFDRKQGRVYILALTFSQEHEAFWRSLFQDMERMRPPVHGLTLPIAVPRASDEAYADEVPLVLPLARLSFAEVAEVKNALYAKLLGAR